jgi:hypothetical protein
MDWIVSELNGTLLSSSAAYEIQSGGQIFGVMPFIISDFFAAPLLCP